MDERIPAIGVAATEFGVIGLSFVRLSSAAMAPLVLAPILKVRMPARRDWCSSTVANGSCRPARRVPLILGCGFFGMTAYQGLVVTAGPLVNVAIAAGLLWRAADRCQNRRQRDHGGGLRLAGTLRFGASTAVWLVVAAMVVQVIYHPLTKPLLKKYSGLKVATYGLGRRERLVGFFQCQHSGTPAETKTTRGVRRSPSQADPIHHNRHH